MSNYSKGELQTNAQNTSWTKIFSFVSDNSTVLDFGCSDGNLGKELKVQKNCTVYGVEIDKDDYQKAKGVLDGVFNFNIETSPIPKDLNQIRFDTIILADVIEHFVHPAEALRKLAMLLKPSGQIIFSIPNMAHISVRLALMHGNFSYNETGLLDKTHLHFYDFNEVQRVMAEAGLQIKENDANILEYPPSFIKDKLNELGLIDNGFIKEISTDRLAKTFQFVGCAVKPKAGIKVKRVPLSTKTPEHELSDYIENIHSDNKEINKINKELASYIKSLESEISRLQQHADTNSHKVTWRSVVKKRSKDGS
jgi:2-polyprenyl-3-methyl-5-hydroxy-6-metoxy-1,4-benzoquinol methylase